MFVFLSILISLTFTWPPYKLPFYDNGVEKAYYDSLRDEYIIIYRGIQYGELDSPRPGMDPMDELAWVDWNKVDTVIDTTIIGLGRNIKVDLSIEVRETTIVDSSSFPIREYCNYTFFYKIKVPTESPEKLTSISIYSPWDASFRYYYVDIDTPRFHFYPAYIGPLGSGIAPVYHEYDGIKYFLILYSCQFVRGIGEIPVPQGDSVGVEFTCKREHLLPGISGYVNVVGDHAGGGGRLEMVLNDTLEKIMEYVTPGVWGRYYKYVTPWPAPVPDPFYNRLTITQGQLMIDTLKSWIDQSVQLGWLDEKLSDRLKLRLDAVEKYIWTGRGENHAKQALNIFMKTIERERGDLVKDEAYFVLYYNAKYLLKYLPHGGPQ